METIQRAGEAEQTINKSRFIARAEHCANEREVLQMLKKMASQHPHATHLAFAYQLKTPGGIVQRMNDAAEPSGTAGRPILQHIEGMGLVNVCVGVIRYYGGINLGTGGLEASVRIPYVEMAEIRLEMDYGSFDIFCRDVEKLNGRILDKQFDASVHVRASVPAGDAAALQARYQRR
jgi:putative IMPACT (imprinted ancient) family translation regulator